MEYTTLQGIERDIVQAVSVERLMADTEAIARFVRLSGSEDERRSFDYIAGVIRELGLEPILYSAPAYISLPDSATLEAEGRSLHAITHSMAASTPPEGVRLELVDVGVGEAEDYTREDVRGRAVLIDGIAMPEKVTAAQEAGAAACIFANSDEHIHEMIVSEVWGSPTPEERGRLPHIPVVTIGAADSKDLRRLAMDTSLLEVHLTTRVSTRWTEIPTLVAQLDGMEEPEKFVLFSGHVDSWHYGAMDNGTANATMLETLRALLPYRDRLWRSLRLAFWSGHSHGRYAGSAWYADTFWEDLHDNCVLHLNVDSVGGQGATVLTEAQAMAETRHIATAVIGALTGDEFVGTRSSRAGDQSFQGLGIPSLFMSLSEQPAQQTDASRAFAELVGGPGAKSGGLGWWWHTPEDTVDKIDPSLLLRDAQIYALTAYRLLSAPALPLDVRASATDLLTELRAWQAKAAGRFDLSTVVARAEELAGLAARLHEQRARAEKGLPAATARRINDAIMAAERPLVRLNYAATDPYSHDPGHGQPPVPLLSPLDELLQIAPDSDTAHELTLLLVRRCNRLTHELAEARKALQDALALVDSNEDTK